MCGMDKIIMLWLVMFMCWVLMMMNNVCKLVFLFCLGVVFSIILFVGGMVCIMLYGMVVVKLIGVSEISGVVMLFSCFCCG